MSSNIGEERRKQSSHDFFRTIAKFFSFSPLKPPLSLPCKTHLTSMLGMAKLRLRRLCSRLRWPIRRRPRSGVVIRRFGRTKLEDEPGGSGRVPAVSSDQQSAPEPARPIRIATFNAAMFSMAPAVPKTQSQRHPVFKPMELDIRCKSANDRPKSILKQQSFGKSKLRVSINLPDNEISLERSKQLNSVNSGKDGSEGISAAWKGKAPVVHSFSFPASYGIEREPERSNRSILDVLKEVGADIIGLQNVKAEEEKGMKPLSDLADGLGMKYVFAESWAPEYGNAILSRWPIKQWKTQKIFDDTDFRNVLKAKIEVPKVGEVNFHCTHLDHLDENWRMKQIDAILRFSDGPYILAGGLNSLDATDYSAERWADIVKYYEEIGKPTPKVEVMKYLKAKQHVDAKNFAGECEAVVVVAKGQDVQGTCKYGTRVDYILASSNSPYKFVPGSYGVLSSKGTSDHHIVKVDITIVNVTENDSRGRQPKRRVVKIDKASSKGIWRINK